jgi:GNAT superfamily N-acetyltransferase
VTTRSATRDDIPALVGLTARCDASHRTWTSTHVPVTSEEEGTLNWEVRFSRAMADIRVAVDGDAIVGVVAFARAQADTEDRTPIPGRAHISAVFVDPAHWRRGIARRLLNEAEEAMVRTGFSEARLWTLEGSPAEALYTALGWDRDGSRGRYPAMGLDTVGYAKRLPGSAPTDRSADR